MESLTTAAWEQFLTGQPGAHVLQSGAWGELKAGFGWQPLRLQGSEGGAQILLRRLPLGLTIAYLPKGPLGADWTSLWPVVHAECRRRRAIFLKLEPDAWQPLPEERQAQLPGFIPAAPIQPPRTVVVSLLGSEEDWLARMKQKTRYNIRLAQKKDVTVRLCQDVDVFYQLMQVTGERDRFGVHSLEYYRRAYQLFAPSGSCALLLAEYQGRPLAGLMAFRSGARAWYFYGASGNEERERMPTYLLQFEAMRWAASHGCTEYDLWGVPDEEEEILEAQFSDRNDGLWGVYRFKRGFGGMLMRSAGAWDYVYSPLLYRLYQVYAGRTGREV
ncbi:MAG TPA: peptidoglycan bridge formation glycyltransferase FemA/FemB family protein [Anaerolineaceae bacterium]|nr:peptidoglycan bridge formation glycyltransferase FemA/FemB family protein [Anaerolineaceae bacterium]